MSGKLDWAEMEVAIACKKEKEKFNNEEGEFFNYGCSCYESALKAFKTLCDDGNSGLSMKITQSILNRLINGQPLTPIEDTDDIWYECHHYEDGHKLYQCKRMSSLFKDVYADGTIEYSDNSRLYCVNIHNQNDTYSSGLVRRIVDKMFPITMPYIPGKPIDVYCEDFLTDERNGDFDTIGVLYALKTENGKQKKIEINRFFREPKDNEERDWIEISIGEYMQRKLESERAGGHTVLRGEQNY